MNNNQKRNGKKGRKEEKTANAKTLSTIILLASSQNLLELVLLLR